MVNTIAVRSQMWEFYFSIKVENIGVMLCMYVYTFFSFFSAAFCLRELLPKNLEYLTIQIGLLYRRKAAKISSNLLQYYQ